VCYILLHRLFARGLDSCCRKLYHLTLLLLLLLLLFFIPQVEPISGVKNKKKLKSKCRHDCVDGGGSMAETHLRIVNAACFRLASSFFAMNIRTTLSILIAERNHNQTCKLVIASHTSSIHPTVLQVSAVPVRSVIMASLQINCRL